MVAAARFTASAQPANDAFANAINLAGPTVTTAGSNVGATKQFGQEPNIPGNFGGASVWWNWTAVASGPTTIDTEGSSFNTLLGVYTGTAGNALTLVGANDDFAPNTWSRVQFTAVGGTVYRILVDGFRTGGGAGATVAQGSITLNIRGVGGVNLDTPTNGMVFTVGDPIPVGVSITPDFPNPPASRVDFYRNGTLFASDAMAPFSVVTSDSPPGTNTFYAVGINGAGASIQSSAVNVFVQSIGVTLLTPADGAVFLNTNPITVTAHAYLPVGSITNIEFFVDGLKFAEDAAPPYSMVWSNVAGGSHRITARGRSDTGTAFNAAPVNIAVAQALVLSNSVWKYLDNGTDQGTNWIAPTFDDSSWAAGPAPLGYADSNGRQPLTTNSFGPTSTSKYITTYYRQTFVANNAASYQTVLLNVQRDDGAVVYLNGVEVARLNMPAGVVTSATLASANAADDGGTTFAVAVSPALLREGMNVLAVEIHQDAINSSDIWFVMEALGIPPIIRNASPTVTLDSPRNDDLFFAPPSITLAATAMDSDGRVTRVEFYDGNTKIGEVSTAPYNFVWNSPVVGPHALRAVAFDEQGANESSTPANIMVYDLIGTPFARVTAPPDGHVAEGPTNILASAFAASPDGVAGVEFYANSAFVGSDDTDPYTTIWNAPFGVNTLTAVAIGSGGRRGTSVVSTVTITIPPTNVIAPTIAIQSPLAEAVITNLTNIIVTFSERVQGVDAADLFINGVPATGLVAAPGGSNYVFSFPRPDYGEVFVSFVAGHGITDFGYPSNLPFDDLGPGARWDYELIDRTPPVLVTRSPAPGTVVTALSNITVTFSEPVTGVDASDLRVNGVAATNVIGNGTTFTFAVVQPPTANTTVVSVTWATNSGIMDVVGDPPANAFNATGATWNFVLDTRSTLLASNSNWRFIKGLAEASTPTNAWRQLGFDDSGWSNAPAPFFYGDPYTNVPAGIYGTHLTDMQSNYSTIYLRQEFIVTNRASITNLFLNTQSDDGFIAWLNGVEVLRVNVPAGEVPYTGVSPAQSTEPNQTGSSYIIYTMTNAAASRLINGTNILAVHALNQSLTTSSDFGFNAQLYMFPADFSRVPPRLVQATPAPGDVFVLTNLTVTFSEGVSGVDATDLLVNGVPASSISSTTNITYVFAFAQPGYGPVVVSWAQDHGILDFDDPPKPFDGVATGSILNYTLINPSAPTVIAKAPAAGSTNFSLTQISVTFSEPVAGVDAADLLVAGTPAVSVSNATPTNYIFTVNQPPYGTVTVRWAQDHGITDAEAQPNAFDPARPANQWNFFLLDPRPTVTLTSPTNNAFVLAPANVPLRATATDRDGTIALVEFFEGGNKIGEATNAPYSFTWLDTPAGQYTFRAVATDNSGLSATSTPVILNVVTSLPITLVRGPYLQSGSAHGGVVRWRSDRISDAVVRYGTDLANLDNVATEIAITNEHIVQLTGLQADTRYFYSIGSSSQQLAGGTNAGGADYWFRTAPLPGTRKPARFWVLGDSGTAGNGSPDRAASVRDSFYTYSATNGPADFWLMLGDNAYNSGTDTEHQSAVFNLYPSTLRNLFLWPTIGNHETSQSFTAVDFPYLHIFSLPKNGESGGVASGTEKYYSFDQANIHFICLDTMSSGRTTNTAMVQWLVNDLATTVQEWVIVFFHHPPYTKGSHNSDAETELIEIRQNILPILEANGVDLVLSGHSHCYERSFFLNGHYGLSSTLTSGMKVNGGNGRVDGDGPYAKDGTGAGTSYIVAGNGGQATGGSLNHPAHFLSLNELGSLVIDVASNRLDVVMLSTNAVTHDRFTIIKNHLPPIAANGSFSTPEDTEGGLTLPASSPEGNPITITVLTAPRHGTARVVDAGGNTVLLVTDGTVLGSVSNLVYSPAADYNGPDAITYKVTDAYGESVPGTVSITVRPVNDPPLATPLTLRLLEDDHALFLLRGTDPDGDTLSTIIITGPAHGNVVDLAPQLAQVYHPNPNYFGPDSFTYKVSDGELESDPVTVSITVLPVNDPPNADASATPRRAFISPNNFNALAVLDGSRSSDIEGDFLHFLWREGATPIAFGMIPTVTLVVGSHSITLEVSDGTAIDTDALTLLVRTPAQAAQEIIDLINRSALDRKDAKDLIKELEHAQKEFEKGKFKEGIKKLESFQKKVRDKIGKDQPALAALLIGLAQEIIDAIGDPPPRPHITHGHKTGSHGMTIKFTGKKSKTYIVEASADMVHWEPIGVARDLGDDEFDFDDTAAPANSPRRFYRIRAP